MERIEGGNTRWARKTLESEIFFSKPEAWFKIWFYLVNKVQWKEEGRFDRGAGYFSNEKIANDTHTTIDQVKRALHYMRSALMISTKRSTRGFNLKVLNFAKYQEDDNYRRTNERTRETPEKHQRRTTIEEEGKKVIRKEGNNNIASPSGPPVVSQKVRTPLQEVVDHFFDLQALDPSMRSVSYPRHVRDGQALLKASGGDPKKAKAVLDALHRWATSKKLTYTIGTALKRWKDFADQVPTESWDDKMKRVEAEINKYKLENNL